MRPWDGKRYTKLRDPDHPGWPEHGECTEDWEVARDWAGKHLALLRDETRRRQLKLPPRPRDLERICTEYLDHRLVTVEKNTWGTDRTAIAHLKEFATRQGVRRTDGLTYEFFQELVNDRIRQGYARSTVKTYLIALSAFTHWLGLGSVWGHVTLPEREASDAFAWTDDEALQLREAARKVDRVLPEGPIASVALELGLCLGLRRREIFALFWNQIDAEEMTARVTHQVVRDSSHMKGLKSDRARVALFLQEWWQLPQQSSGLVVQGKGGRPLSDRKQQSLITRVFDTAGLATPGAGWHTLRHTYSRLFIERGGSLEQLQKSLGHSSIVTTERTYGHFTSDVAATLARGRIYGKLRVHEGGA